MKGSRAGLALALMLASAGLSAVAGADLPPRYKAWLEDEVALIISPRERSVFLELQNDRQRDMFIEAFWKHRDPDPRTARNEFREEHYARLAYADEVFGRGTPRPGRKTDQGRVYIVLGPPRTIDRFENVMGIHPVQVWLYYGDPQSGLPAAFNVVFFKREGTGEYVLYSPADDGPLSLIADLLVDAPDVQSAYKELLRRAPNLAPQSLTLIPSEHLSPGFPSLASNQLLATVFTSPQKRVQDDYALALLRNKDVIEVEYSANYIGSDGLVLPIREAGGLTRIHTTIEPRKLSVAEVESRYEVPFVLNGRITDKSGRTVYQYEKSFTFSIDRDRLKEVAATSVSLQDSFPLIPGRYTVDILLKNTASKEFTSLAAEVEVPQEGPAPSLGPLALGYGLEDRPAASGRPPFLAGGRLFRCQGRRTFSARDRLVIFGQIYGLGPDLRAAGRLRRVILRDDKELARQEDPLASLVGPDGSFFLEQELTGSTPGYYRAAVTLLDAAGKEIGAAKADYEISLAPEVPRPLVIAKVAAAETRADDLYATGIQSFNTADVQAALTLLGEARRLRPGDPAFAAAYAQALYAAGNLSGVMDVLAPFAGEGKEPDAEIVLLLGKAAHGLGRFEEAAAFYSSYLTRFGANIEVLNFLGTCHYQLGRKDEALKAWKKSLELNPDQERIRKLVDNLSRK